MLIAREVRSRPLTLEFSLNIARILAALSLALAAPAFAQTTVTLQQGLNSYTGTTDTRISQANPAQIFGASANIGMAQETMDSLLVRFNIFVAEGGPVPDGATITSATLSMYKWGGPTADIKASRLLKSWNETQTNWTVAAGATNWTTAGAQSSGTGNDYEATADGQATVGDATTDGCGTPAPASCWLHIDVTAGVQAFAGGATNYGWKLAQVNGTTTQKNFTSSENTANPTLRPILTVTYTEGQPQGCTSGDNPPTGTTAAGSLATTVPTFHSMSVYYNPATEPTNETVWMRYRRACESTWREGWPLWFDPRTSGPDGTLPYTYKARGSAVYLEPNTKYYFQLGTGTSFATATWHHHVAGTTWSETFPEDASVVNLTGGDVAHTITAGGSPTAYKVYDGQNTLINSNGTKFHCVRVAANFVIVRNVLCRGSIQNGIRVNADVTDVVIEDNDISDWSHLASTDQPSWGPYGGSRYAGIRMEGNNSRIVIQRNRIHDPKNGSFPWDITHPQGATGITLQSTNGGQNVIRYNEIYTSEAGEAGRGQHPKGKWMLDGIMGSGNFSADGSPGADSDIYHNIIRNVFDDGIQAEGGGRNVRVWGNYIDHTFAGVATSVAHLGPIYVFRNVVNRSRRNHLTGDEPDDDGWDRGDGFKAYGKGGTTTYGGGRQYIFNNTLLQQPGSTYVNESGTPDPQTYNLGTGHSIKGSNGDQQGIRQTWTRNNVFQSHRSGMWNVHIGAGGTQNSFDYDLYNCCLTDGSVQLSPGPGLEQNGFLGAPTYKSGHGWSGGPLLTYEGGTTGQGSFQLDTGSSGLNAGTPLPNFTVDIDNTALAAKSGVAVGGTPDVGAHDSGLTSSMKFGLPAAQ
jgi:hypothetical protein